MYKCPECNEQTKGASHNGRGVKCDNCWHPLKDEDKIKTPAKPAKKTPAKKGD